MSRRVGQRFRRLNVRRLTLEQLDGIFIDVGDNVIRAIVREVLAIIVTAICADGSLVGDINPKRVALIVHRNPNMFHPAFTDWQAPLRQPEIIGAVKDIEFVEIAFTPVVRVAYRNVGVGFVADANVRRIPIAHNAALGIDIRGALVGLGVHMMECADRVRPNGLAKLEHPSLINDNGALRKFQPGDEYAVSIVVMLTVGVFFICAASSPRFQRFIFVEIRSPYGRMLVRLHKSVKGFARRVERFHKLGFHNKAVERLEDVAVPNPTGGGFPQNRTLLY